MNDPLVLKPIIDTLMQNRARAIEVYIAAYMHLTGLKESEIELLTYPDGSWECRPLRDVEIPWAGLMEWWRNE